MKSEQKGGCAHCQKIQHAIGNLGGNEQEAGIFSKGEGNLNQVNRDGDGKGREDARAG